MKRKAAIKMNWITKVFKTITISSTYLFEILSLYNFVLDAAMNQLISNIKTNNTGLLMEICKKFKGIRPMISRQIKIVSASIILRFS